MTTVAGAVIMVTIMIHDRIQLTHSGGGHTARSLAMGAERKEDSYELTVQTDSGTRVARFSLYADAMTAYDNARLDGAISAVVDRIQHTPDGMHSYRLAVLA
jgi:hypothetical protein